MPRSDSELQTTAPFNYAETKKPDAQVKPAPSHVSKRKREQTASVDDALFKLVEQASGTQRLCQQVDQVLQSNQKPRTAFSQWIAAETESLPDELFRRFQGEVFTTIMKYHDIAAHQQQHPHLATVPHVMMQHTSTPSYPVLSRPASAPLPAPVSWHMPTYMPTHMGNHDWTQAHTFQQQHQAQVTQQLPQGVAPTMQQHRQPQTPHDPSATGLSSLNLSGLSGMQFSPMPSHTTCTVTSESNNSTIGAQVVQSSKILQNDQLLDV